MRMVQSEFPNPKSKIPMTPRVQIICGQPLPFGGFPTTGAGLRAWSLGQGLESCGFEVIYSLPREVVERLPSPPPAVRSAAFEYGEIDRAVQRVNPTVVVLQGWPWANLMADRPDLPLAIDLTGPHLIESLFSRREDTALMPFLKLQALRKADFITCAGEVQRHYFLPWLLLAGHDLLADPCPAIPMSLSPALPEPRPPAEPTFVYGGIFLPWQDPSDALRRVVRKLDERGKGRLVMFAGPHPTYEFPTGETPTVVHELQSHPRVEFAGVVPYETMVERYLGCSVAVDLMTRNVERELAFTTRTVVALWCGLPVIYNDYAELSAYLREYRAGWTIDPEDGTALDAVLDEVFDRPDAVREYGQHAQCLVRERLTWDRTIIPLAEFCRHPFKRERQPSLLDRTITPLDDRLSKAFVTVKNSSVYRWYRRLKRRR